MPARRHWNPRGPELPARLRAIGPSLAGLTTEGGPLEAERVVAIVGPREPALGIVDGARFIAGECARRGVVVASGGARGVDAAAHEATMAAGGITWAILPTGCEHVFPPNHGGLYARIVQRGGTLVWPFRPEQKTGQRHTFLRRNRVLTAIADAVVVVQATLRSGTLHTCRFAREANRPLFVVPPTPWVDGEGSLLEIDEGAIPLHSMSALFSALGLLSETERSKADRPLPVRADPDQQAILELLGSGALHPDELIRRSGLGAATVSRALLTLSLDAVVVDAPDGRYRLCR